MIVILHPGALGDALLATDALAALRRRFPNELIELIGHAGAGSVLRAGGLIDSLTSFEASEVTGLFSQPPRVAERWRGTRMVVLWMRDATRLADAFQGAGAQIIIADSPEPEGHGLHVADYLTQTLHGAGVAPLENPAWFFLPNEASVRAPKGTPVLLHPGSGSPRKNWPAAGWAELAQRLQDVGHSVALLLGPADAEPVRQVLACLPRRELPVLEPPSTLALAQILEGALACVGNDSGVSHLSARLGVATVAIFGATDPGRWAPRGPNVRIVEGAGRWPNLEEVWDVLDTLLSHNVFLRRPARA